VINWSEVSPALVSLFSDLAFPGINPAFLAQWHNRSREQVSDKTATAVLLRVTNTKEVGEDETRYEDGDGVLLPTQVGQRLVTLEIRVESYENTDTHWAWATVERIRSRLRRPSSLERLRLVNCALVRTGPALGLPEPRDGHMTSIAVMDVVLTAAFADPDEAAGWIERIELTSHLTHAPDVNAAAALNVTGELLPPE
jgi:hypothetical protein